ncbi:DUF2892 domain-containing protein [Pseudomonas sp. LD120]|uniref:DUF2892 domain-containing protein n=1 Tax=Pseudomonas sp. LD120 TaxID=485751 RepID=UPI001359E839|nr:DUF2892 domain-containing protein [Pseudomonas sp. LD120]KAF0863454.1 DUF2892 domain-containing protein [Pseudomonas sp. LD120]
MSERQPPPSIEPAALHDQPTQSVQGWERIGSLAGGVAMMGKGLRRGGVLGLIQVAIGGVALARGISGQRSVKSLLKKSHRDINLVKTSIERTGQELRDLEARAASNDRPQAPKAQG